MSSRISTDWHSKHLGQQVRIMRWGHFGQPVLVFPTAGGDAEEVERFKLVEVLAPFLDAGRIKLYSCDSVAGKAWFSGGGSPRHCSRVQNLFDSFVAEELLGAIRRHVDDGSGVDPAGEDSGTEH